MIETLNSIGIDTKKIDSKPIHNRKETLELLKCSNPTLTKYKRRGWLKHSKFKNQTYYTADTIYKCLEHQLNIHQYSNNEWDSLWD